jgi:hypothetical protein
MISFFKKKVQTAAEDPFTAMAAAYRKRLESWPLPPANVASGTVAVLITPWMKTAVPLFALELARTCAEAGHPIVAIADFTDIVDNSRDPSQIAALEGVLAAASSWLTVRNFEPREASPSDLPLGEKLAKANAVRNMRGESQAAEFHDKRPNAAAMLASHFRGALDLLESIGPARLLLPGGIYGLSGCYVEAARRLGIPFQTFDSGPGVLRLCQNGVAAHLADIPAAFAKLLAMADADSALDARILARASQELDDRLHCRDFRHFQSVPKSNDPSLAFDILVPLNISWDSAALALDTAFPGVRDWLGALLEWLATRPGLKLCIRQHPRERLGFAKSNDDLGDFVAGFTAVADRVRYVRADEKVSTYDLLEHARVVLPHSSTFGIEAAFAGKPVIVQTSCYYSDLGFVRSVRNAPGYLAEIDAALTRQVSPAERRLAAIAYFLTQECAYLKTDFTPMPDTFAKWSAVPPAQIWDTPELRDLRASLCDAEPLSLVRARRILDL